MKRLTAAMVFLCAGLMALRAEYSQATLTTTLPGADTPVTYKLDLFWEDAPTDTLSPLNYLIEWTSTSAAGNISQGFTAYFDGHFYRSTGSDITAYDFAEEPERFAPGGDTRAGIQNTDAFLALIPAIAERNSDGRAEISDYRGETELSHARYEYDTSGRVVRCEIIISPDTRQEQVQTISWTYPAEDITPLDLPTLQSRHPDAFASLDLRSAGVAGLPGHPLPGFNAPTADGSRYAYTSGQGFRKPMVIIALDGASDNSAAILKQACEARDAIGAEVMVMVIFRSNRLDRITPLIASCRPDITLHSARKALRELGIDSFPTAICVAADGTVSRVEREVNNNLSSFVISASETIKN